MRLRCGASGAMIGAVRFGARFGARCGAVVIFLMLSVVAMRC